MISLSNAKRKGRETHTTPRVVPEQQSSDWSCSSNYRPWSNDPKSLGFCFSKQVFYLALNFFPNFAWFARQSPLSPKKNTDSFWAQLSLLASFSSSLLKKVQVACLRPSETCWDEDAGSFSCHMHSVSWSPDLVFILTPEVNDLWEGTTTHKRTKLHGECCRLKYPLC